MTIHPNTKPEFVKGEIIANTYDGIDNDLLTGGLGKSGLAGREQVLEHPDAESLRTMAIHTAYRGLMDLSQGGGYGTLYGPNVGPDGPDDNDEGKIPGKEYIAYADDGTGMQNVTLMIQVPDSFDPRNPRIVTAPSSGSRGIYGAVPVVGEWGLRRGFAVAYTDKGTGTGLHDFDSDTVNAITGERLDAASAGKKSHFTAAADDQYKKEFPHRVAFKHAHSGMNPEADWGDHVLMSVKFAFYVLNLPENYGEPDNDGNIRCTVTPENTLVIASGISNGGSAAVRAAERDEAGLIDGVAVSEPNLTPVENRSLVIRQGETEWRRPNVGRPLLDYSTILNIYQPCACLDPEIAAAPMNVVDRELCENRCRSLREKGLLQGDSVEALAAHARKKIHDYGFLRDQDRLLPSHLLMQIAEGISVAYANAYGRFRADDHLCGFSFAGVDSEEKTPAPLPDERLAASFGDGNGIVPTCGVELINDHSLGGPMSNRESVNEDGVRDMNLNGAMKVRRLATGKDGDGHSPNGEERSRHERIAGGMSEIRASGNLMGLPAVIVNGRSDAILPPNHTSRAYAALNSLVEGAASNLRYYEITNAQHLDMLNAFSGFDSAYVPLHYYFIRALDILYDHLKNATPLPPSQLVNTTPRGVDENGNVPDITLDHVPPISANPRTEEIIRIEKGKIDIPD